MGRVILLTGGAGFIGTEVARRLLTDRDVELLCLVMTIGNADPGRVLARDWWDAPELTTEIGSRVFALGGDVRSPRLGLSADGFDELVRRVDAIVHAAADLRLDGPVEELRATNVGGVRHVLDLAREIERDHGLERFVHVSTAYVAGGRSGTIEEGPASERAGFRNAYERTKYEGESLVRDAMPELPIAIARPGMVVGDSRTGAIKTFNTFYVPLRLYLTGRARILPTRPDLRVNIVPVDHVAAAIARMVTDPAAPGRTFHLTAPTETLPTAGELLDVVRRWAREELGVRLPRPVFVPPLASMLARTQEMPGRAAVAKLRALLPYFEEDRTFRRDNTDQLLGPYDLRWRDYVPRLLAYAARYGFLHRTERTVQEQLLHRLAAGDRRIRYHDVVGSRHRTRRPAELRRDVLAAAASLRRRGVVAGDRVAVVGPNGTRYLTLDIAIGLVGAASVPIYPTSPPGDIAEIVTASGAHVLFVGSADLLDRLPSLPDDVQVVSFSRSEGVRAETTVETWEAFLSQGGPPAPSIEPAGPGDVATIRYTSGTTGPPKGVVFDHRSLRWMGETMASLVPWRTRTRHARYVSFLPMNHVVEGILATYGPGYLPAPVDVWFVEDLADLPRTLRLVRPVVFFGVPRVYEKLWDRFVGSFAGSRYLRSSGSVRRLIRPIVRRGILRRAGLDRCAELIVGSAPASDRLLASLHELGIEVHDAYGLSEAPLVALNRIGRNRIGTVGEPLPNTEVRIGDDGEVLVRGPQVTQGYLDRVEQPFRDGWLATGDLGRMAEGALVIDGRKKELLKTSYGKYVRAGAIEARLRELPGVREALVVAEGRPYCGALVWREPSHGGGSRDELDAGILRLNRELPHPEQVKRWTVVARAPSVANGELTPNLKLRRPVVLQRLAREIDALYAEDAGADEDVDVHEAPREGVRT